MGKVCRDGGSGLLGQERCGRKGSCTGSHSGGEERSPGEHASLNRLDDGLMAHASHYRGRPASRTSKACMWRRKDCMSLPSDRYGVAELIFGVLEIPACGLERGLRRFKLESSVCPRKIW